MKIAKNALFVLISLSLLICFVSCSNGKQPEKTDSENDSSQQTESSQDQNDFFAQANLYEQILETTDVKCQHRNRGYYNFLHKSGNYIFYMTMEENSCLMSLNINTGETNQIAYVDVDVNNPIQYSSDKLTFNGSESGYAMQLLQYDIASEKLSIADKESNTMSEEETLYLYEQLTDFFRENVNEELQIYEDNVFRTDNDLYIFIDEYGVYKLDENNKPIQVSQYPADNYIIYNTEQKIIYQDNAIYYRAAAPHNDLIIKLENGKETIIKTADELQSKDINFTGSLISNTLAIRNDEVWYELSDERIGSNKVKYYINYIACVDENGNIKNIFNIGEPDLISFDDGYIYCYGLMNQEVALENDTERIYGFFRVKIDDTKVN